MEDPYHSEHPEDHQTFQEEHRKDAEKHDDPVHGEDKLKRGLSAVCLREKVLGSPDPEYILDQEKGGGNCIGHIEKPCEGQELIKCAQDRDKHIHYDVDRQNDIKNTAWNISFLTYLDDLEYSFFQSFVFHT